MDRIREHIRVEGAVQGVGFRPFVYALAERIGLSGLVGNDPRGVFVEVEGLPAAVAEFRAALGSCAPPLAVVERVSATVMEPTGEGGFVIERSRDGGQRRALVSPDTATCPDCLAELFDPGDRRYRYPFINCTNCGPRFTIVEDLPYDRSNTTMAGFAMCRKCTAEYHDPADRRFHAQPVCCAACGPVLVLRDTRAVASGRSRRAGALDRSSWDPIPGAAAALRAGQVLAMKGVGGYHLAADTGSPAAVDALRSRKHREDKAFALMVPDIAAARVLCHVDQDEERALASIRRPVVVLRRRPEAPVPDGVAPGNRSLGLMLPYTPAHHLLARELGRPFVLTSGNVSDEPIAYEDGDAFERLRGIADVFLTHDRPIHTRTDDSVVQVHGGREVPVRRSRGYVPQPLTLPAPLRRPVLGCGAELKNTFCLAEGSRAFVSQHIGDLENHETLRSFRAGVDHFRRLFRVEPEVVAHDLHPEYLSTKYALDLDGVELTGVQHHHAHVASCLADNGEQGPVIGVAFDGLGYGSDGALWGGEFLVARLADYERVGHLAYVPMPGGAAAIAEPWRMAAVYLDLALDQGASDGASSGVAGSGSRGGSVDGAGSGPGGIPDGLGVVARNEGSWAQVRAMVRAGVNAPPTSSAGRLFDAVAAITGVRDRVNYEGQAAVELEQLARPGEHPGYPCGFEGLDGTAPFRVRGADLVRAVVDDLCRGTPRPVVAARFHHGVAEAVASGCARVRDARGTGDTTDTAGLDTVALSGGVFQNALLRVAVCRLLERHGFRVLTHHRVPPNDGGISLGQVAVAGARDAARRGR